MYLGLCFIHGGIVLNAIQSKRTGDNLLRERHKLFPGKMFQEAAPGPVMYVWSGFDAMEQEAAANMT